MSDNKKIKDKRDSVKIDMNDPSEVEYVHQQFPDLNHEQILKAIKLKGPLRKDVIGYLKKSPNPR